MTTSPYQLAENVFVCLSDNHFVFLDLPRNKYFCLSTQNTQVATSLFTDSADRGDRLPRFDSAIDSIGTQRVADALKQGGLLVQGDTNGKEAAPLRIQAVTRALLSEGCGQTPAPCIGHWKAFLHASLQASWKLRRYSMLRTVRGIANQKQRHIESRTTDYEALSDLVAIFNHLRPFYVRKYLCLYDSLALVQFLASYCFFPQWVFGVKGEPFGAHCWLQEGDSVLNDTVEFVQVYTPIMAI